MMTVPLPVVFLRRITIEERALSGAFGPAWLECRAYSWRLLPRLW
ncbi:hypothetical protein [Acetobacter musti]|nr:hypothetical protein [Acetobacter musti]